MCARHQDSKPSIIGSILQNKCPRCRRGSMFQTGNPYQLASFMKMNERCPVCTQPFDMEVGFYYGTSYVSYAASILLSVVSLLTWWLLIGFSLQDNRFFWWLAWNAVLLVALQPPIMRFSRSVWLACFVYYDREWRTKKPGEPERVNDALKNAW